MEWIYLICYLMAAPWCVGVLIGKFNVNKTQGKLLSFSYLCLALFIVIKEFNR